MILTRYKVNLMLLEAGLYPALRCRKEVPCRFGLPGRDENNIIFDESTNLPLAVVGWEREAERNTAKFIEFTGKIIAYRKNYQGQGAKLLGQDYTFDSIREVTIL